LKWNMGWMHDTLKYFATDPLFRASHHNKLTFGLLYAYSEHFILPLSHDEVVHMKGSLYGRMPGGPEQKFQNLRALLAWMWVHPGGKLLFMAASSASPRSGTTTRAWTGTCSPSRGTPASRRWSAPPTRSTPTNPRCTFATTSPTASAGSRRTRR